MGVPITQGWSSLLGNVFWLAIFRESSTQKSQLAKMKVENYRVVLERKLSFKKLNHVDIFTQIVQYLMNYLFELLHNTILIRYLQCKQCYMHLKNKTNSSVEEMKERRKTVSKLYNSTLLDKTVYTCIMNGIVLSVILVIILTHKYMYISIQIKPMNITDYRLNTCKYTNV